MIYKPVVNDIIGFLGHVAGVPDVVRVKNYTPLNGRDDLFAVELCRDRWGGTYTSDNLELVARPGEFCEVQVNEDGDICTGVLLYLGNNEYGYQNLSGGDIRACRIDKVWRIEPPELEVVFRGNKAMANGFAHFLLRELVGMGIGGCLMVADSDTKDAMSHADGWVRFLHEMKQKNRHIRIITEPRS